MFIIRAAHLQRAILRGGLYTTVAQTYGLLTVASHADAAMRLRPLTRTKSSMTWRVDLQSTGDFQKINFWTITNRPSIYRGLICSRHYAATTANADDTRPLFLRIIHAAARCSRFGMSLHFNWLRVWTLCEGARKDVYFFFFLGKGRASQRIEITSRALRWSERSRI